MNHSSDVLIRAARLIDGTGEPPLEGASVLVSGETVAAVFQGPVPEDAVPPGAEVLDFPGHTLLPGLIDCHVHLDLPGDGAAYVDCMDEADGVLVASAAHNARVALEAGITTLRDTGGRGSTTFELRRAMALGRCAGADLVLCGQPITITGGHTWQMGGEADGVDGVRRKVRELARAGADFIKVMGSGGGTPGTMAWLPSYGREELAALVDEAHRQARRVTVHCLCAASIDNAVAAGADQIEHAGFLVDASGAQRRDAAVAERLAAAGIPVTSTLAVGDYVVEAARAGREDAGQMERWERMRAQNMDNVAALGRAGVRFVAGTDAGWRHTPFDALPVELCLMREAGLTAMDAIVAGTGGAARTIGVEDRVGTVRAGLRADLLVVDGDPLADLDVLRRPRMVMQRGQVRVGQEVRV
jgi:imidazolonepropionase-like amidohydrolase